MPLLLVQLGSYPDQIAATKIGECKRGGVFFLDFARPIQHLRWGGIWNRWVGIKMSLVVPVRHQGEQVGRRAITVDRGDPYFKELQRLWKERFPSTARCPAVSPEATAAEVQADFEFQFPEDSRAKGQ
jgi:hypothetical protein